MIQLKLIAVAIGLLGLAGAVWFVVHSAQAEIKAEWKDAQLQEEKQAKENAQESQRLTAEANARSQKVQDDYAAKNRQLAVAAASLRTERDGLRSDLIAAVSAASNPASTTGRIVARSDTIAVVVNECADAIQTMASALDDRETRLKSLQDWVKTVMRGDPDGGRTDH